MGRRCAGYVARAHLLEKTIPGTLRTQPPRFVFSGFLASATIYVLFRAARQGNVARKQPLSHNDHFCDSASVSSYSTAQLHEAESRANDFLDSVAAEVFQRVSMINLPGPKGNTIWDELRELRDTGCLPSNRSDQFGTDDRHSFALWQPHIPCLGATHAKRLGGMDGDDDVRQLCGLNTKESKCLVYSLGVASEQDMGFERMIVESTECEVHSFDCTMGEGWRREKTLITGRHYFHPICISSVDGKPSGQYLTIESIYKRLRHHSPTILKMDIEAFEHNIIHSWRASHALPEQLNMELHCTTEPISGSYRELSLAEQTLTLIHLYRVGYRLARVAREGGGIDATLIRTRCE